MRYSICMVVVVAHTHTVHAPHSTQHPPPTPPTQPHTQPYGSSTTLPQKSQRENFIPESYRIATMGKCARRHREAEPEEDLGWEVLEDEEEEEETSKIKEEEEEETSGMEEEAPEEHMREPEEAAAFSPYSPGPVPSWGRSVRNGRGETPSDELTVLPGAKRWPG